MERGESKEQALVRECEEELNVTVSVGEQIASVVHEYPDLTVRVTLFNCSLLCGEPQNLEHNAVKWITADEIPLYDFCAADVAFLQIIKGNRAFLNRG